MLLALAGASGALAYAPAHANAGDVAKYFTANNQCLTSTWTVPHGVTQVNVTATGVVGEEAGEFEVYNDFDDYVGTNMGGAAGPASKVYTTITVTPGQTLYVGVANGAGGPNAIPGGQGGGGNGFDGGDGGAASWLSSVAPTSNASANCLMGSSGASWLVIAAGGGGGGGPASKLGAHGGAGGNESAGGNGLNGTGNTAESHAGVGGSYSNITLNESNQFVGSAGGGGTGGTAWNCTSGTPGSAGALLGDPMKLKSPAASLGGEAGYFDPVTQYYDVYFGGVGVPDCSQPNPDYEPFASPDVGGSGGGGGGGLYSGGGGGGSDDSGRRGAGGGAAGTSYSKAAKSVSRWYGDASVYLSSVLTMPAITSANNATFVVGQEADFTVTSTGVDTPYVMFTGAGRDPLLSAGVDYDTATYPDGSGAGTMHIEGTPTEAGVYPVTIRSCNAAGCADQAFTVTIHEAPSFTSNSNALFAENQANTFTVTTNSFPDASITEVLPPPPGCTYPGWLNIQDNGNDTATLTGTPPLGGPDTYCFKLQATNYLGSAQQTITLTIVSDLDISPGNTRLVPGFDPAVLQANPFLWQYQRGFLQQFTVMGTRPSGATFNANSLATWTSTNTSSVTVSSSGFVKSTPLPGVSTVSAGTSGALNAPITVTVASPSSIKVTPTSLKMIPGQTQQYTAWGCYANPCAGNYIDITNNVTWESVSNNVAMSDSGVGTAQAHGYETVFAKLFTSATPGQISGWATAEVTRGNVTSIVLNRTGTYTVPANGMIPYSAYATYQDGSINHSEIFNWTSTDQVGSQVAFLSATMGSATQATGWHTGESHIKASFTNEDNSVVNSAVSTFKVINIPTSLSVSGCGQPITKARTCQLTATATMSGGSTNNVTSGVTWNSSSPATLSISETGLLTATGSQAGAASNVWATFGYTGVNGPQTIESNHLLPSITLRPPVSLEITPTSVPALGPGDSQQFAATGTYADGSTVVLTNQPWVTFTDDSGIASFSMGGLLQIINTGTPTGSFNASAFVGADGVNPQVTSNSVPITVEDPLHHISVYSDPSYQSTITAGQITSGLYVIGYDERGEELGTVTNQVTFNITPDGTCSNNPVICTSTVAGAHTITATHPDAIIPLSTNSKALTVNRASTTSFTIGGGSSTIFANTNTKPFTVTSYDQYGNSANVTNQTTFRVEPVEVTSGCNSPGNTPTCYARTVGAHTIIARYNNQDVDLPLTVTPSLLVTSIDLSNDEWLVPHRVAVGAATPAYTATVTDVWGNVGETTKSLLSITPDGVCDSGAGTCTPTAAGVHTVVAKGYNELGQLVTSNQMTFDAVVPEVLTFDDQDDDSVAFGRETSPYTIYAWDDDPGGDYFLGDVTSSIALTIGPDGSCDDTKHTCIGNVGDSGGSFHTVSATYTGGAPTANKNLEVIGVDHIEIVGDPTPLRAGETTPGGFLIWGYDASDNLLDDVSEDVDLEIAPNGSCNDAALTCTATVADTGGSTHTITATYDNGVTNVTDTFDLEVEPSPIVADAELSGGSASIAAGAETSPYEVHGLDQYGNDIGDLTEYSFISIEPGEPGAECSFSTKTCTATNADEPGNHHTITAIIGAGIDATAQLDVTAGALDHLELSGGNDSVMVGVATNPYAVEGFDTYDNSLGDVTAASTLTISPDGSCNDIAHTCTATANDFYVDAQHYSRHTVTADNAGAAGISTVFANPNDPPLEPNMPSLAGGMADQYNDDGVFTLEWNTSGDPTGDDITYTLQRQNTTPGSDWQDIDNGISCVGTCQHEFGGAGNPPEDEGSWTYRVVASDGYSQTEGDPTWFAVSVDNETPTTTDDVPTSGWATTQQVEVTLTGDDGFGSGVQDSFYRMGQVGDPVPDPDVIAYFAYNELNKPLLADEQVLFYYSEDKAGNREEVRTTAALDTDLYVPFTGINIYSNNWVNDDITLNLTPADSQTFDESGVLATYFTIGSPPNDPTTSSALWDADNPPVVHDGEQVKYFTVDIAGNAEPFKTSPPALVDVDAPVTTAVGVPDPWDEGATPEATVTLSADDNSESGVLDTYYLIGDGPLDPDNFWMSPEGLDPGQRHVYNGGNIQLPYGKSIMYGSRDNVGHEEVAQVAPVPLAQTVNITSTAPAWATVGQQYAATATSSSGLPVSFIGPVAPFAACVWDQLANAVVMFNLGTCNVVATQAGNSFYARATGSQQFPVVGLASAPQNFNATAADRKAVLSWQVPAVLGNTAITGYRLRAYVGATLKRTVDLQTSVCSGSDCAYDLTGLIGGISYTFKLVALNVVGEGALATKTVTPFSVPTAPRRFSAIRGNASAVLLWRPPTSNGGRTITAYKVQIFIGSSLKRTVTIPSRACRAGRCTFTLKRLRNGRRHKLNLAAVNAVGAGPAATTSVMPRR